MRIPRALRSAAIRAALVPGAIFGASALILFVFLYWAAIGYIERGLDRDISTGVRALTDRFAANGADNLIATIRARRNQVIFGERLYLIADGAYQVHAGTVAEWPAEARALGWHDITLQVGARIAPIRLFHTELSPDLRLAVGRDASDRLELRAIAINALLVALALMVLSAIAGGMILRRMFQRRIEAIDQISRRIVTGDMTGRALVTGSGDVLDLLGQSLNRMLDQIDVLMASARDLSNAIAHDLRTPLARVRGRLEAIVRDPNFEPERAEHVQHAIAHIDGVIEVFNAILRIAEIDAGARPRAFSRVNLRSVVSDLAELYEAVVHERAIRFDLDAGGQIHVQGDRQMLSQALANLLDNAIKFTPDGGRVTVGIATDRTSAQITIEDSGPGIPDAEKSRVTERFYRAERSRATPGSGLGLALVEAVARLHGGALRLGDNSPTGLRAVLELPMGEAAASGAD